MRRNVWAAALLVISACSGSVNPTDLKDQRVAGSPRGGPMQPGSTQPGSALHFLTPDPGSPGLISDTVRFYAVVGQERIASLYYRDSVRLATLDVPAGALTQTPDGTPLQAGDSLLITIAIADSSRLVVGFEPSGLVFDSHHPAVLSLSFAHADSALSRSDEARLAIWGQEHPNQSWHSVKSQIQTDSMTVTGAISGFTVYATAY